MRVSAAVKLDTDNTGNLPWIADFIVINNPGNRWIYLPQIRKWIPPTYMNAIYAWGISPPTWEIVVGNATGNDGQSATPIGVTPGAGNTAVPNIEFVSGEQLTPDPGTPYGVNINAGTVNLAAGTSVSITGTPNVNVSGGTISIGNTPAVTISGNVTFSNTQIQVLNVTNGQLQIAGNQSVIFNQSLGNGSGTSGPSSVPTATQSIIIIAGGGGGASPGWTGVTISGVQSGITLYPSDIYYGGRMGGQTMESGIYVFPWNTALDTQIQISITNSTGGTASFVIIASPLPVGVGVYNTPDNPLYVRESVRAAVVINSSLASGATVTILAGVAGRAIRLFNVVCNINAAATFFLQRSTGPYNIVALGQTTSPFEFHGMPLANGESLQINNAAGATAAAIGGVNYDLR